MKMKKFILLLLSIMLLTSCGEEKINTDVPLTDISTAINNIISNADKLSVIDPSFIAGITDINVDIIDDYIMMMQTKGTEIDQYGIFKVSDTAKADELKKSLNEYILILQTNQEQFNYLPEETIKLREAEVFAVGPYVVYTIMSEEDKTVFMDTFNGMIK